MATRSSRALWGGVGLSVCAFVAKAVGAIYRLPLTNLLGAKGIGGYQLVFPVYAFVLALTSSGMPLLLARQIAKDGDFGYAVFRKSIDLMAVLGGLGAAFLLCWGYPFALWQGWREIAVGYMLLAPAVLAVALAAPFRGWFTANMHWGALAGFTMCEQLLKLAGLGFAYLVREKGTAAMTVAAIGGVTLAELLALGFCWATYLGLGYRFGKPLSLVRVRPILLSCAPITAANLVAPTVQFVNSLLLVKVCVWCGFAPSEAVESYGVLTGAVGTLTSLPVVLAMSFATLIVPVVSRAMHERSLRKIKRGSADTLFVVVALSLPCAVGLALLAPDVVGFLYPKLSEAQRQLATQLLTLGCVGIPFAALQQLYAVLLQSVDHSRTVAKQALVGGVLQVGLGLALIPALGITGALVGSLVASAFVMVWHGVTYRRLTGRYDLARPLSKCTLAGCLMALFVWALRSLFANLPWRVVWIVLLACALYGILLWALGGIRWLRRPTEEKT